MKIFSPDGKLVTPIKCDDCPKGEHVVWGMASGLRLCSNCYAQLPLVQAWLDRGWRTLLTWEKYGRTL